MLLIDIELLIDLFNGGGYLMWLILFLSIISFLLMSKSYNIILNYASRDIDCINYIKDRVTIGEAEEVEYYVKSRNSIFTLEILSLLQIDLQDGDVNSSMNMSLDTLCIKLFNNMDRAMIFITTIPFIGLLGTIIGLIKIQYSIESGFAEAIITTAFSIMLLIPLLIFYWYMDGKIEKVLEDFEEKSLEIIQIMKSRRLWK